MVNSESLIFASFYSPHIQLSEPIGNDKPQFRGLRYKTDFKQVTTEKPRHSDQDSGMRRGWG